MSNKIEQLLRVAADFRRFCDEDGAVRNTNDSDALCEEELFLVAAATKIPENPESTDHSLTSK